MGVNVTYAPAAGKILSGRYTLSTGITPSIIMLETAPLLGVYLDPIADITFGDGDNALTLSNCRLVDVSVKQNRTGTTWFLQFADERWKWAYGFITGEYNKGFLQGQPPAAGTVDRANMKNAWELAGLLQAKMGGFFPLDRAALPDDDYPPVKWDFSNPAEELAKLADRYGLKVCYDPLAPAVSLVKPGEGQELPAGLPFLSLDAAASNLQKPEKLLAVCERVAYEWEFDLEAVGLETDGALKLIAALSYKPAGGWGAGAVQGDFADIADKTNRDAAEKTVFKWYRVKPPGLGHWLGSGKTFWKPSGLSEMLPLQKELISTTVQTDFDGEKSVVHREAYYYGTFEDADKKLSNRANVDEARKLPDCNIDGKNGIVKFSVPMFSYDGSGNAIAATLKLRCVVHGPRFTVERTLEGGLYGTLIVPCRGLQVYDDMPDFFGLTTPPYGGNVAKIEAEVNKILDVQQAAFADSAKASARYIGIHDIKLDGRIAQLTWEAGPDGAFTSASLNTEHAYHLPSEDERRQLELARPQAADGMKTSESSLVSSEAVPKNVLLAPRYIRIYNGSGMVIPAFGLVEVTDSSASGHIAVTRPTADYLSVGKVLVNGEQPIADGCYGLAQASDAFMFLATGSPAVGDEFGTTAGSFSGKVSATEGTGGILVCGVTTGVSGVALARFF